MPIDPRHGRNIPAGRDVAAVLRAYFAKIATDVSGRIARGQSVDLRHFAAPMVRALRPHMMRYYTRGAHASWQSIAAALAKRRKQVAHLSKGFTPTIKAPLQPPPGIIMGGDLPLLGMGFDVLLPQTMTAIDHMVFQFVRETLDTAKRDAEQAYEDMRQEFRESAEGGESLYKITGRIQQIFNEPMRAFRISTTETSRFMHAGQMDAAKESRLDIKLEWLASSDACKVCLDLDGDTVKPGEPFMIYPKAKPAYRMVLHPPAHPHCMCATKEEIE